MATWKVTTREIDGEKVRGIILPNVIKEDLDHIPSSAYGSIAIRDDEGRVVDANVPEDRFFPFAKAGARLETKKLVTVKGVSKGGVLNQYPFEDQINNHVQSPETGLGIQGHIRNGATIWWDPQTGNSLICMTWGCWAEAQHKKFGNFCTAAHRSISLPEKQAAGFGAGATTSATWTA